ncbi:unnamed protein product [Gemmataceae bacterium]|nr:unnamed protein product [Gemmataceae bacterium]VTU02417.1 unnamed protein product [Gemmataceae bacterium]
MDMSNVKVVDGKAIIDGIEFRCFPVDSNADPTKCNQVTIDGKEYNIIREEEYQKFLNSSDSLREP